MLTLKLAATIVDGIFARAAGTGSKPLTVAVLDNGGVLIMLARQDGCGTSRPKIAIEKADSALALDMPTRTLVSFYAGNPGMHEQLRAMTGKALIPLPGGVLIRDADGRTLGAVGVTGGSLEAEEGFAIAAIQATGLVCEPDQDPSI